MLLISTLYKQTPTTVLNIHTITSHRLPRCGSYWYSSEISTSSARCLLQLIPSSSTQHKHPTKVFNGILTNIKTLLLLWHIPSIFLSEPFLLSPISKQCTSWFVMLMYLWLSGSQCLASSSRWYFATISHLHLDLLLNSLLHYNIEERHYSSLTKLLLTIHQHMYTYLHKDKSNQDQIVQVNNLKKTLLSYALGYVHYMRSRLTRSYRVLMLVHRH